MKENKKRGVVFLAILMTMVVLCAGCGDDGGDSSPTSVSLSTDVSGVWKFVGQLSTNTCNLDAISSVSGDIRFNQSGSLVNTGRVDLAIERGSSWYFYYSGTTSGSNVSLAATDPYVLQDGGRVIHFGSGIDIQNIRNNVGSGSLNVTGQYIQGGTGSCQTVWTGTWTRQ